MDIVHVVTLALGLQPRQGLARLWAKREARESHLMFPRVQNNVKEWTFTLPSELPFWELESQWTFKSSKGNCRGQKSLDWGVPYNIGNFLQRKCLKWFRITHLDIWNPSYGQKKGWDSNWQFDSRPLKVRNRPNFLACRCCATYHWKDLNKGNKFALDLISIRGLHTKLWAPKVVGAPTLGISGLSFGSPGTKCHLDVGPTTSHRVYYKGAGGGFAQVQVVVNLVSLNLPVAHPSTKSVPTMQ